MLQNMVDLTKQGERLVRAIYLPHVLLTGGYFASNPNVFNGFERKLAGTWNVGVLVQVPVWNWFEGGLVFEQCVVTDFTEHEMGGHNEEEIHIRYNVFCCFFDSFDCQFHAKVFVHNNIFVKGTSLKGNAGKPFENSFDNGLVEYDNIGKLDLD